jgi:hypothetical protein
MTSLFAAIDSETLKNVALGLSGGSIIIGLIMMKVISSVVGKLVSMAFFAALALGVFSQRAEITSCVDAVKSQASSVSSLETTCTFFGQDVTLKVPLPAK